MSDGFLVHTVWNSDLAEKLACFDSRILFYLLEEHTATCFDNLLRSFSVRGWVYLTLYIEGYFYLVDDVRFA